MVSRRSQCQPRNRLLHPSNTCTETRFAAKPHEACARRGRFGARVRAGVVVGGHRQNSPSNAFGANGRIRASRVPFNEGGRGGGGGPRPSTRGEEPTRAAVAKAWTRANDPRPGTALALVVLRTQGGGGAGARAAPHGGGRAEPDCMWLHSRSVRASHGRISRRAAGAR